MLTGMAKITVKKLEPNSERFHFPELSFIIPGSLFTSMIKIFVFLKSVDHIVRVCVISVVIAVLFYVT